MTKTRPFQGYRRWRRRRNAAAPSRMADWLQTMGVLLLLVGAALLAVYVMKLK